MNRSRAHSDMPTYLRRVADDFARMGEEIASSRQDTRFEAVTTLALDRVPKARACSITRVQGDRFLTAAATDEVARRADRIQYEVGSGPCIDAIVEEAIYQPKDLAHDDRWPEYGRRVAEELGLRSMLSFRMSVESAGVIAGLNLYAEEPDAFDDHDLVEGLLLTTHGAQAVATAHLRDRNENLERALASNRDIGTAMGILMGLHRLSREQAFDLLRIASQNTNRKLHDVALDVIDSGTVDVTPHGRT